MSCATVAAFAEYWRASAVFATPAPDAQLTLTGARLERIPLDAAGRFSVTLPLGAQFALTAQAGRMVNGRRFGGNSPYRQIGRQDRDAEITIILKATP